jgi:hypothetical protein
MAFLNGDEKSRVTGFLSNGGGTITFRVALTALAAVTLWLLQAMGSQMLSAQAQFGRQQARMAQSLATLAQQTSDTARLAARDSDRLDDHEHRITVLEVREAGQ